MKKQIGVLLAAFLILLLGWAILPAPAMPSDDPPEEDIAGSDWRTWGIIDDSGTLVQDGETIPFCACVHTGDTTLYHDRKSGAAGRARLPCTCGECGTALPRHGDRRPERRRQQRCPAPLFTGRWNAGTVVLLGPGDRDLSIRSGMTGAKTIY